MVRANHARIVFFEQHLTMHGAVEFFEITHGEVHIAGFQTDAAHAQ